MGSYLRQEALAAIIGRYCSLVAWLRGCVVAWLRGCLVPDTVRFVN